MSERIDYYKTFDEGVNLEIWRDEDGVVYLVRDGKEKTFHNLEIYFPHEYDEYVSLIRLENTVVFGSSGYSSIRQKDLDLWGSKEGAYERAVEKMEFKVAKRLLDELKGIQLVVGHGSTPSGVDLATIRFADRMNIPQFGFSCMRYLGYVPDKKHYPVHVSVTKADYSTNFVKPLDILVAFNGRKQAFEHDIKAIFDFKKFFIPVDVIRAISSNGQSPAFNKDGEIEDAIAAYYKLVRHVLISSKLTGEAAFDEIVDKIQEEMLSICREIVDPEIAYYYEV